MKRRYGALIFTAMGLFVFGCETESNEPNPQIDLNSTTPECDGGQECGIPSPEPPMPPEENCFDTPWEGEYELRLTQESGSCFAIPTMQVVFDAPDYTAQFPETYGCQNVALERSEDGCALTRQVECDWLSAGLRLSIYEELEQPGDAADELIGILSTVMRYMDSSEIYCEGTYDTVYEQVAQVP